MALMFPEGFWILLLVALVLCSVGYYNFVWFMSVGYGLAIAGIAVTIAVFNIINGDLNVPLLIMCAILFVYGCRLGLFLLIREIKSAAYHESVKGVSDKKIPIFVSFFLWIFCTVLYYFQTAPVYYRVVAGKDADLCLYIGIVISAIGVTLETIADKQKSAQKKENPHMAATKGLYKMCRCPNYFGEILVWTGVFVSGITVCQGGQWAIAAIGYVGIVYIMFNGAKRLEKRQNKNYGSNHAYVEYSNKTPIIIPLIPLYHLVKEEKQETK